MSILEILSQPFMVRSLLAGLSAGVLLSVLGVFVTLKKQAFFADGIAHASLLGVAIGLLLGQWVLIWALGVAIITAVMMTYIHTHRLAHHDSAIGIVYTVAFALAVSLMFMFPGYRPDLFSYLFGSILSTTWQEVGLVATSMVVVIGVIWWWYTRLVYATFDGDAASIRGIPVGKLEYLLNILVAVAIIVSVKLVGVVLVSGLLLIPAVTARLHAQRFVDMFFWSTALATAGVLLGMIASYYLNAPSGASIVICLGMFFAVSAVWKKWV